MADRVGAVVTDRYLACSGHIWCSNRHANLLALAPVGVIIAVVALAMVISAWRAKR